jgi:hypothetical protein
MVSGETDALGVDGRSDGRENFAWVVCMARDGIVSGVGGRVWRALTAERPTYREEGAVSKAWGRSSWMIVIILASCLVGWGCSKNSPDGKGLAEKGMEKALDSGGQQGHKVDLGSKGSVDLSGLPETLRYPGAEALARVSAPGAEKPGTTYIMKTADAPSKVVSFYKKSLAGWTEVFVAETPEMSNLAYDSPDGGRRVSVVCGTDRKVGGTTLSITVADN